MQANTISQFKGATNYQAILAAIGAQLNDVEEFFGQIIVALVLPNAIGPQLDALGGKLNQGRDGLSDSDYRTILQARVVQYQANGTIEDLIQIMLTLTNCLSVQVLESYPAKVTVTAQDLGVVLSTSDVKSAMFSTKLNGVGLIVNVGVSPVFAFDADGSDTEGLDQGQLCGPL